MTAKDNANKAKGERRYKIFLQRQEALAAARKARWAWTRVPSHLAVGFEYLHGEYTIRAMSYSHPSVGLPRDKYKVTRGSETVGTARNLMDAKALAERLN